MDKINKQLLQTLAYSDLFDYPLTKEEMWKYLIKRKMLSVKRKEFEQALKKLLQNKQIVYKGIYYCLRGRTGITDERIRRKVFSKNKLNIAKKTAKFLSFIPTVLFIGVSGSLAMKNARKEDDIDLFIIVKKNSIWMSRLFVLFFLQLIGRRRKYNTKHVSNSICVNMLVDVGFMRFDTDFQDIYTAHEIVQLKPLMSKKNTYTKFIQSNAWVKNFLPNAYHEVLTTKDEGYRTTDKQSKKNNLTLNTLRFTLDVLAKHFQLYFIRKHQTSEVVSNTKLAFHPRDYRKEIIEKWSKIEKKYA